MQQSIRITEAPDVATGASEPQSGGCCGGSCGCGSKAQGATAGTGAQSFEVEGLTCEHCVRSVSDELTGLAGVEAVEVELVNGGRSRVSVASDTPLRVDDVRAAISEAGYTLVER